MTHAKTTTIIMRECHLQQQRGTMHSGALHSIPFKLYSDCTSARMKWSNSRWMGSQTTSCRWMDWIHPQEHINCSCTYVVNVESANHPIHVSAADDNYTHTSGTRLTCNRNLKWEISFSQWCPGFNEVDGKEEQLNLDGRQINLR